MTTGAVGSAGGGSPFGRGREQMAGVGVAWPVEHLRHLALLDQLALGHDADPVGEAADDGEVVGDEQDRHAEPGLEVLEQLQDLRLDGDVQGGRRLVGDQEVGLVGQRHGDHHPLALAAGQLVREGAEPGFGLWDLHQPEELEGARARLLPAQAAVDEQHLADLALDRVQRVERGHRLLEDHADAAAADGAQEAVVAADQLLAVEADAPGRVRRQGIGQQLQDRQRGHRLARAALADDGQRAAAVEREGSVADGVECPLAGAEGHAQILDLEQGHQRKVLRGSNASRTASPANTRSESITASTMKPEMPSQGACKLLRP